MSAGANTTPRFTATPIIAAASLSAANTALDGTGTVVTLVTGATHGTRIDRVVVKATATTTAGMIRMFLHDGSNFFLIAEKIVSAITPSGTVEAWGGVINGTAGQGVFDITDDPENDIFILPSGYSLRLSTHNAETFKVFAIGATFE